MKLIINTTNIRMGGALQVSYSLLNEFKRAAEHEFHVFLSTPLSALINRDEFPRNFYFYEFTDYPTRSLFTALFFHKKLSKLEAQIAPDFVFTTFGPALWRPAAPHLLGFANIILFDTAPYTKRVLLSSLRGRLQYRLRRMLTLARLKKDGDIFWLETSSAKNKLADAIKIPASQVSVISNNYGNSFSNVPIPPSRPSGVFSFLFITSYYPHKNLEILNELIPILKQRNIKCTFKLTLKPHDFQKTFPLYQSDPMLFNYGPLTPQQCPQAYLESDALFYPTFLEFFTASYPEAMIMQRPIITSDLDFAHYICGNAALYFDPFDPMAVADAVEKIIRDGDLRQQLVENGLNRLKNFDTAAQRAEKLLNVMKDYLLSPR